MKEIGGYIELDTYNLPMLHEMAIDLNCGRNALAYLIEAHGIKNILLPYFLCDSVRNVCVKYGAAVRYYHIAEDFTPIIDNIQSNEWLYIVNYYGQLSKGEIGKLKKKYKNVILDNAQDYFAEPVFGMDTIYTCRKYFGVSDGAFLYSNVFLNREIPRDESFKRFQYILGRYERTASEFYQESKKNNEFFDDEPIKKMSRLTYNLLHGINYEDVKKKRTENFAYLVDKFEKINEINVRKVEGAFMYPLLISDASEVKRQLQKYNIYIPMLWPNVLEETSSCWLEYRYAKNILPLPCDQRYGIEEMSFMAEKVLDIIALK